MPINLPAPTGQPDQPSLVMNRKMRRAMASNSPSTPALKDRQLTDLAFQILKENMERFGNVLTESHKQALYCILGRFTMLATGAVIGRYAYDLPCGGGKTQAIVAWCAAAMKMRRRYSVSICASKVEALCELKHELIRNGVPESEIGLIHSYGNRASLPATDENHLRQIVLVTHARVRGREQADRYNGYRGKRRDLVIWDESLLISDHRSIDVLALAKGVGFLEPDLNAGEASSDLNGAITYARDALQKIQMELDQQRQHQRAARALSLPPMHSDRLSDLIAALPNEDAVIPVRELLKMSQAPLRCVNAGSGGGLVAYEVVVPQELRNVAVLDASWAIRDLERLDRSINDDPLFHGDVKRYDAVTVHQLRNGAGRATLEADFRQARDKRTISREIVEVVRGIPETEGILLFTFKPRNKRDEEKKRDIASILQGDLEASGIDLRAHLPDGNPRFVWLTFGQETESNAHKFCSNVIFVGALHRSAVDIAGAMVGQLDDLRAPIEPPEVIAVRTSEVAHVLYQGINRAACRDTVEGQAKPTKVWLLFPDTTIRPLLETVMPGLQWVEWEPVRLEGRSGAREEATAKIEGYLLGLPPGTARISFRRLRAEAGLDAYSDRTVTRAASAVVLEGWKMEGRSWVRTTNLGAISSIQEPPSQLGA